MRVGKRDGRKKDGQGDGRSVGRSTLIPVGFTTAKCISSPEYDPLPEVPLRTYEYTVRACVKEKGLKSAGFNVR